MAEDGRVSARDLAIQEERAAGGVGLIVFGGTAVHPTSRFPARILIESWDEAIVDRFALRAEAVHRHGAAMIGQLIHLGREAPGGLTEGVPLAPSAIASPRNPTVPREMTDADIREIVESFGRSAANYARGGNRRRGDPCRARLPASRSSSRRSRTSALDAYRGDTLEGRTRFLVEIVEEIRARCGPELPRRRAAQRRRAHARRADARRHARDRRRAPGGRPRRLPVDHDRATRGYVKDSSWDEGFALGLVRGGEGARRRAGDRRRADPPARPRRAGARGGPGRLRRRRPGDARRLRSGSPRRATDRSGRIRPCIGIVQDCRRYAGGVTCTINPRLGREAEWRRARSGGSRVAPRRRRRRRARRASRRRASPPRRGTPSSSSSASDVVGGQLRQAAAGPTREELLDFVSYLERELDRLGVDVRLGAAATPADVVAAARPLGLRHRGRRLEPPARRRRRCAVSPPGTCSVAVAGDSEARRRRRRRGWVLAGGQRRRVPRRAGRRRRARHACPGVGLAIPEESVANVHRRLRSNGVRFRPLSHVARRRRYDGAPCRRDLRRAGRDVSRPRRRGAEPPCRGRPSHRARRLVPTLVAIGDCAAPVASTTPCSRPTSRSGVSTKGGSERRRSCCSDGPHRSKATRGAEGGAMSDRILADGRDAGPGGRDRSFRRGISRNRVGTAWRSGRPAGRCPIRMSC